MTTNFTCELSLMAIKIYKKLKPVQVIGCFKDEGTVNAKLSCMCHMA